jgi:hypothetical protein
MKFDKKKYYSYLEITDFLKEAANEFPDLVQFQSIGLTSEKRKIWLVSLTNSKTGLPEDKPSLWIDANTHASEIAGAQSCLYFIYRTLTNYKKDPELKFLLDHINFYILPQVSPDGAEFFLRNKFEVRSSPTKWPKNSGSEKFTIKDMNQDGDVLLMRKEDAAGAFKISAENEMLMTQRTAFDLPVGNEKYYKLYKEGIFNNFDGFTKILESSSSLDYNRQFPSNFRPEGMQKGAGSIPMMSPEVRAFVDAFVDRHRIFGHIALHTYGGLILRPPGATPEEKLDLSDLSIIKIITDRAAEVSGYLAISIYHDFKYYSRESETGTADDWSFEQRGVFAFTVEIWDVWKEAQIQLTDHVSRYFRPDEKHIAKIFKWAKQNLKLTEFYQNWRSFKHPQLGDVEIGGWKTGFLFRNPPPDFLENEMKKVNDIIVEFARVLPIVKIKKTNVEKLDATTTKLTIVIENQGFLPTNGSQQAVRMAAVKKPFVQIKFGAKLKLISGLKEFSIEHLKGRNQFIPVHTPINVSKYENSNEVKFEWIFQGQGIVDLHVDFQRGGILNHSVKLFINA